MVVFFVFVNMGKWGGGMSITLKAEEPINEWAAEIQPVAIPSARGLHRF